MAGDLRVHAAVCPAYGPPEVVELQDVPSPTMEAKTARVRVAAAAVNFPDVLLIRTSTSSPFPCRSSPGASSPAKSLEVADDVRNVAVGDRVFGSTMVGAFAEEVVVTATSLTRIPEGVEARHAAAFGVAHRTAYHTLRLLPGSDPGTSWWCSAPAGESGAGGRAARCRAGCDRHPSRRRRRSSTWRRPTAPPGWWTTRRAISVRR